MLTYVFYFHENSPEFNVLCMSVGYVAALNGGIK